MPDRLHVAHALRQAEPSEIFTSDALADIDTEGTLHAQRELFLAAPTDQLVEQMMHLDLQIALADNDLRKVDRMCAVAGIDVRYPFLDEAVAEFAARLPAQLLADAVHIRCVYKQAMTDFLPASILRKPKKGFGMPFAEWLKLDAGLRELAYDSLAAFKGRAYLRPAFIDRIVRLHRDLPRSPFDGMVWDIMMLELWLRSRQNDVAIGERGPSAMSVSHV